MSNDNNDISELDSIKAAALEASSSNMVSVELTDSQALGILFRSKQLVKEGRQQNQSKGNISIARQIDRCYRQKNNR